MLKGICKWIAAACFSMMASIWKGTIMQVTFTKAGLSKMVALFSASSVESSSGTSNVDISQIIKIIAWIIIAMAVIVTAFEGITAPLSSKPVDNPAKSLVRLMITVAILLGLPMIKDKFFQTMDILINALPTPSMNDLFASIITFDQNSAATPGTYLLAALMGIGMMSHFIAAIISFLERFIIFGLYIDLLPIAVAYSSNPVTEDVTKDYFKTLFAQIIGLVLTKILFIGFAMQVEQMGAITFNDTSNTFYLELLICEVFLSIITSVEDILSSFGLRSYPVQKDANEIAAHSAKGLMMLQTAIGAASSLARAPKKVYNTGKSAFNAGAQLYNLRTQEFSKINGENFKEKMGQGAEFTRKTLQQSKGKGGLTPLSRSNYERKIDQELRANASSKNPMSSVDREAFKRGAMQEFDSMNKATESVRSHFDGTHVNFSNGDKHIKSGDFVMKNNDTGKIEPFNGTVNEMAAKVDSHAYTPIYTGANGKDFSQPVEAFDKQANQWKAVDFSNDKTPEEKSHHLQQLLQNDNYSNIRYTGTNGESKTILTNDTMSNATAQSIYSNYGGNIKGIALQDQSTGQIEQFSGSADQLLAKVNDENYIPIDMGHKKDFSQQVEAFNPNANAWVPLDLSDYKTDAEKNEAISNLMENGASDIRYFDTSGNQRTIMQNDKMSTIGSAQDVYDAFGLQDQLGDKYRLSKNSNAMYMNYTLSPSQDGTPTFTPSQVAIGVNEENKGDNIKVIDFSDNIDSKLGSKAATSVISPNAYTEIGDGLKMYSAPKASSITIGKGTNHEKTIEDATWNKTVSKIIPPEEKNK